MRFKCCLWHPYREAHLVAEFADALERVFPGCRIDEHHFIWKHRNNPWGESIIVYARCMETGKIAAIRAFMPWKLQFNGNNYLAFQPCDTATLPGYQRQGLFSRLTRMAITYAQEKGGHILFNFPNNFSKNGYIKLGWRHLGSLKIYVKPLLTGILKQPFTGVSNDKSSSDAKSSALNDVANMFLDNGKGLTFPNNTPCISGVRDVEHLLWRIRRPGGRYQIINTNDAFALIRMGMYRWLRETCIIDFVFTGQPQKVSFSKLIRKIIKQTKPSIVSTILTQEHPLRSFFRRTLFFPVPTQSNFTVFPLSGLFKDTPEPRWALSAYDIDTF